LWAVCNGKNDCCGTIHGVLSHGPKECKDSAKTNYTALDEENCPIECAVGEIQCLHENVQNRAGKPEYNAIIAYLLANGALSLLG